MDEMLPLDPNLEAQFRPRSGTWPMNRPNIPPRRQEQERSSPMLGTTIEERSPLELFTADQDFMTLDSSPLIKDDYLQMLSDTMPTELDSIMMGLPTGSSGSLDDEYFLPTGPPLKLEPLTNVFGETVTPFPSYGQQNFDDGQAVLNQNSDANLCHDSSNSSPTVPTAHTVSVVSSTTGATLKVKSTRKNAWGSKSYAELITQAIESSPQKRLTLAEIYEWMVKNISYFSDKGETNSSAGWKNSIRHNLSLHAKFKRIQNDGAGKSSWWMMNYDAKPAKPARRHTDNSHNKALRQKSLKAKQKADFLKKQKAAFKTKDATTSGLETTVSKAMGSEYRTIRTDSNASSMEGRISPSRFLPQDLAEQSAPPLSPFGSGMNLSNLSTSLPSAFDIFGILQPDSTPTIAQDTADADSVMHDELLKSLAGMDVIGPPAQFPGDQIGSEPGMYMQQPNSTLQSFTQENLTDAAIRERPNLATLLQKTPPQRTGVPVVKQEPNWNSPETSYGYSEYQNPQLTVDPTMQSPPQFGNQIGTLYEPPQQNVYKNVQYLQNQTCQQQADFTQQPAAVQRYVTNQECQQSTTLPAGCLGQGSNLLRMGQGKFPSDINLDGQDLLESGDFDMAEALNCSPFDPGDMDFDGGEKRQSFVYDQGQTQQAGNYTMGSSRATQQPPSLAVRPNLNAFIPSQRIGAPLSMGGTTDRCRLDNPNFQRIVLPGQASTIGPTFTYTLQ